MFGFIRGQRRIVYFVATGVGLTVFFAAGWVHGAVERGEVIEADGLLWSAVFGFVFACLFFMPYYFGVWFGGGDGDGGDGGGGDAGCASALVLVAGLPALGTVATALVMLTVGTG